MNLNFGTSIFSDNVSLFSSRLSICVVVDQGFKSSLERFSND